jgi:uncharacterized secreted protein with C-terminal beta-propeller domain
MVKYISFILLLSATLFADTTIQLQKGWQFIGFPTAINNSELFNHDKVDILWGYDASTQKWLGFSPDKEKQRKINQKYQPLTSISPWQGVWIHNNQAWELTLKESTQEDTNISLQKGWNLISLPQDITISPTLFKEDIVWKYDKEGWKIFSQDNNQNVAPPISKIESAEALWVKSSYAHTISLSEASSALHTFASKEAMETYIKEMVLNSYIPRYYNYPIIAIDTGGILLNDGELATPEVAQNSDVSANKAADATSTNLQESDVDESDILKHNGEHIFFYDRGKNIIHITTFVNLTTHQKSAITPITLPANTFLQALYIHGDKLIMISNEQRYYYFDQRKGIAADETSIPMPVKEEQERFTLTIYDISDIDNITPLSSTIIDGNYQNSRIIEDKLYLISQFYPRLKVEYPKILVKEKPCQSEVVSTIFYDDGRYIPTCGGNIYEDGKYYRYDYNHPIIKESYLIPTINKGEKDLITHDTFYAPHKLNQFPTITILSEFNINTNSFSSSRSIASYTNKLYASSKNLYLTSTSYPYYYDFQSFHEREMVYKFSLGENFGYQAKGFVEGVMLNQFSMSEKEDILRVATTSGNGWRGETQNSLFTLAQDGNKLEVIGSLSGLGKEGERIQGVRFLGDRGYVVTFRRTDPLYTLDIKDPTQPQKVGQLEVNGFSSYIHPVDENYILTLGRDASDTGQVGGFIVQLFNISNFAQPSLSDIKRYALNHYAFDAEYTPQAFVYRASDKLFGITYHDKEYAMMDIFQIDTNQGKLIQRDQLSLNPASYEHRGLIFNNQNQETFSTLFSGSYTQTKSLGALQ